MCLAPITVASEISKNLLEYLKIFVKQRRSQRGLAPFVIECCFALLRNKK